MADTAQQPGDGERSPYTIKSLCQELIPGAIDLATENGRYAHISKRDTYYKVRNKYLTHPLRPYHREYLLNRKSGESNESRQERREAERRIRLPLDYDYFCQSIYSEWEQKNGMDIRVITEPLGVLIEPHTGEVVDLGTKEVEEYDFPSFRYDKIFYCEKRTERDKFTAHSIAEKYDMALVFGSGYANVAMRNLLKRAEEGEYQIFCWPGADPDGYNIGRTLREETARMPGFSCEIIDLGLTVEMGLELATRPGVQADLEPFEKGTTVSEALLPQLSPVAYDYFVNRRQRIEINSIDPPSYRMQLIEDLLRENGVRPKLLPPADNLEREIRSKADFTLRYYAELIADRLLDVDAIEDAIVEEFREHFTLGSHPEKVIRASLGKHPEKAWDDEISRLIRRIYRKKRSEIEERVAELVLEAASVFVDQQADSPDEGEE